MIWQELESRCGGRRIWILVCNMNMFKTAGHGNPDHSHVTISLEIPRLQQRYNLMICNQRKPAGLTQAMTLPALIRERSPSCPRYLVRTVAPSEKPTAYMGAFG